MSSDFPHYNFRMPNIGFQNLPLNIYIVVFGTAIFVFILSLLFCCYLIRLRHQAHKEFYAYKQVILKEKVKELNLHELCAVCLEDFKPRDELGICPCALLSGWRFGRCVHCATCQFCSWPSCTVSRTVDPHRDPCPGQRTLYSSPKNQTAAGSDAHVEPGGTQAVSVSAALPGAPAATSLPHEDLGPARLETQTSGSCDNQSTLTLPHAKRSG